MSLTEANVQQLTNMVAALGQRVEQVREASARLNRPEFWRSPDGQLSVGSLTPEDRERLDGYIRNLLDEAEAIIATARGMMGPKSADAL